MAVAHQFEGDGGKRGGRVRRAELRGIFRGSHGRQIHGRRQVAHDAVQQALDAAVFNLLDMIVVFPVEDEHKLTDGKGRVLPDAFLMKRGSTPRDLAYQVHTDIGEGFLYAIDAKTGMRVKDTLELKTGDIIKIVSVRK